MLSFVRSLVRHLPVSWQGHSRLLYWRFRNVLRTSSGEHALKLGPARDGRWLLTDGRRTLSIAAPSRVGIYRRGIEARLAEIQRAFHTDVVELRSGDVVIDIGANIGEFSLPLLERDVTVHAFEMDPNVIPALRANLGAHPQAFVHHIGLWNENTSGTMHLNTATADTSLIANGSRDQAAVRCQRLDDVELAGCPESIKLLKCDAEGAEPEVLAGALRTLARTDFVAVDCGPERGEQSMRTNRAVARLLGELGFAIILEPSGAREVLVARNTRTATPTVISPQQRVR
ncbi:MAG: FkbM family methyltransferase [Acidobacteria bacterium]|nr:FkbM family methyltransferase [Acidobacteriota bacterium]